MNITNIEKINPHKLNEYINKDSHDHMIELFFICCIFVAGKKADTMFPKAYDFVEQSSLFIRQNLYIKESAIDISPFENIKILIDNDLIEEYLKIHKTGNYSKMKDCLEQTINNLNLNGDLLRYCDIEKLESIKGIGPKTSRFFLSYAANNYKNIYYGIIDTHIKKFLKEVIYDKHKSLPSSYTELEFAYIDLCLSINKNTKDFDLEIWNAYSSNNKDQIKSLIEQSRYRLHEYRNSIKS
jgi:hypothetical protein